MEKPNIFSFATRELSQDAVIAWLASWADPSYSEVDFNLHSCGLNLIKSFYKKHDMPSPAINKINVETQVDRMDVLITVNDSDCIIIEDKTNTKEHGKQLKNYLEKVINKNNVKNIIPIYFKTYEQSSFKKVEESGYKVFSRDNFFGILKECENLGCSNQLFLDYINHLKYLDSKINAYKNLPLSDWSKKNTSWQGLFKALQAELKIGKWGYVPNPSGGFMGFWFGGKDVCFEGEGARSYILLAEEDLLFKIAVKENSSRRKIRSSWYEIIMKTCEEHGFADFRKPDRWRTGKDMT